MPATLLNGGRPNSIKRAARIKIFFDGFATPSPDDITVEVRLRQKQIERGSEAKRIILVTGHRVPTSILSLDAYVAAFKTI